MTAEELREQLLPHADRKIRAFLRGHPDPTNRAACELRVAFWDFVYRRHPHVTHAVACRTAAELVESEKTIGELLEGWVPEALQ